MGNPSPFKGMTKAQIHAIAQANKAKDIAKHGKPRKVAKATINDIQLERAAMFGGGITKTTKTRKPKKATKVHTTAKRPAKRTTAKRMPKGPSATSVARKQASGIKRAGVVGALKTLSDARALANSKPAMKTLTAGRQSGLASYAGGGKSRAAITMRKADTSGITNAANKRAKAIVGNANKRAQGVVAKAQAKDAKSKHKATHGKRVTPTKRSSKK
jgi:hypothetical protein